jgi:hypothetical protein
MKKIMNLFFGSAVALTAGVMLQACTAENPFAEAGEGTLRISTELRGDIKKVTTRAVAEYDEATLNKNLVVYIENSKGVIRKYLGYDNLPESVSLPAGSYVIEGWTGDSVPASFTEKFYRGYERFEIEAGISQEVELKCNIANTLASVSTEELKGALTDLKVTVNTSNGLLEFTSEQIESAAKGYFMVRSTDTSLHYKIEGTQQNGSAFVKEGDIENVQRSHEYQLNIIADANEITTGGALIRIEIADIPTIDEEVVVFPAPGYTGTMGSQPFDMEGQIVNTDKNFKDIRVRVLAYKNLKNLTLSFSDNFTELQAFAGIDLVDNEATRKALEEKGIIYDSRRADSEITDNNGDVIGADECYLTFTKDFLDGLPASETEYWVEMSATDGRDQSSVGKLRIANSDAAIERQAPVGTAPAPDAKTDPMAVLSNTATLTGYIYSEEAVNYGIKYREAGSSDEWTTAYPNGVQPKPSTRAGVMIPFTVTLKGLKAGTSYEYYTFCDGYEDNLNMNTFTTEGKFIIPNASFEEWGTYYAETLLGTKKVIFPGTDRGTDHDGHFWDSGNEGGATANKLLTDQSTDMVHSGTYSARLASTSAFGIIAAGNIFTGYYKETDGTNGVLEIGRDYDGSHPSKLRVYANYRPGGGVIIKSGNEKFVAGELTKGGTDQGQIFIALTVGNYEIRTNPDNRKLFDKNDPQVLAYGQVTWKEAFGPDGELQMVEIPIEYNDRAKTEAPTHLVIVCSASKFGDYFCGSESSVMYLDDFELVYE